MPDHIRVLIADDHAIVREGVRLLLEGQPDFLVVAEADNGASALRLLTECQPDILILDARMPEMDGIQTLREIRSLRHTYKVVMLSMHDEDEILLQALHLGACGYVLKSASSMELIQALRVVAGGEMYLSPQMTTLLVKDFLNGDCTPPSNEPHPAELLSARELEVFRFLAEGLTNAEIARRLVISPSTVQTHRARIQDKLGVHSRSALVKYAVRHGLTQLD